MALAAFSPGLSHQRTNVQLCALILESIVHRDYPHEGNREYYDHRQGEIKGIGLEVHSDPHIINIVFGLYVVFHLRMSHGTITWNMV